MNINQGEPRQDSQERFEQTFNSGAKSMLKTAKSSAKLIAVGIRSEERRVG